MTELQAMDWHFAEARANRKVMDSRAPKELREPEPTWFDLTETRRGEIRSRVRNVLHGEIPRSRMGPGDLAVYFGRYRMIEQSHPATFPRHGECHHLTQIERHVWYDCLEIERNTCCSTRLFRNLHVGNANLTNLQIGGQMIDEAYVNGWYLSVGEDDDTLPMINRMFTNATVTLTIGDMPQAQRKLSDLWHPCPLGVLIPERQGYDVRVEFYGKVFNEVREYLEHRQHRDPERDPFRLWIHLEGWWARRVW